MQDYSVFGGVLRSELEFPRLAPVTRASPPDWTLRIREHLPDIPVVLAGAYHVGSAWVKLYRSSVGFRLQYSNTGAYEVSLDGRELTWYPSDDPKLESVRGYVLGHVLAVSLLFAGTLCLHGSAVALGAGAVAFVAPKGSGKSTMAVGLTTRGGRLITDDMLAVDLTTPPMARPGVHSPRLWDDSLEKLGGIDLPRTVLPSSKSVLLGLSDDALMSDSVPLQAVYVIVPRATIEGGRSVSRRRLGPSEGALALIANTKLGPLLAGGLESAKLVSQSATLARLVPVYELSVVRDFQRLGAALEEIVEWHSGSTISDRDAAVGASAKKPQLSSL